MWSWRLSPLGLAVLLGAAAAVPGEERPPARPPLRVLVSSDAQPEFFAVAGGPRPGVERELLEAFGRAWHLRVEAVPVAHFDDVIPALLKGDGDVIAGIVDTPARREQIAFTGEVLPTRYVAVTRRPHRVLETLAQLREERVGVVRGTTWEDAAREAGVDPARIVAFPLISDLRTALASRRVTAGVMPVSEYLIARRRDRDLQAGAYVGVPAVAAWGVRQQDTALLRDLDRFLEDARRSGQIDRIVTRYFGREAVDVLGRARESAGPR
jgi:ABC-type amino acid transport substrate-binding protein